MKTTNKLISSLDSKLLVHTNNIHTYNTRNKLLDRILNDTENEFYRDYNTPLFSGMSTIISPTITNCVYADIDTNSDIVKTFVTVDEPINVLNDLIKLCDKYPAADNIEYNINMKSLHAIKPYLLELEAMIGIQSVKETIVDQIIYFIQDLHKISPNNSDYMHTVIYGPPGTGKTELAKIIGKVFSNLGMLSSNVFKKVTRDNLIAGFLGQTALKTKQVIKECIGGVLFIDEAYALGNKDNDDSFAKESIDTICEALSDHKKDFMCIIAGYEKEIHDCFFSYNPGLESRFTWKFKIDEYNATELRRIFEKQIHDCGWSLKEPLSDQWFEKHREYFTYYGRDMEVLFSKVKIAHSRRVFCLPKEEKTKIICRDLEKGFENYKKNSNAEKKQTDLYRQKQLYNTLYC